MMGERTHDENIFGAYGLSVLVILESAPATCCLTRDTTVRADRSVYREQKDTGWYNPQYEDDRGRIKTRKAPTPIMNLIIPLEYKVWYVV